MIEESGLIKSYLESCKILENSKESEKIDLNTTTFVYPTFAVPILMRSFKEQKRIVCSTNNVSSYLNNISKSNSSDNYIGFQRLPRRDEGDDCSISKIDKVCNFGKDTGGRNAYGFVMNELINNIYQHSECDNAYIFAQKYPTKGFTEICVTDDGISIPGSYEKYDIPLEDDLEAIKNALEGYSTKDKGTHERGYGFHQSLALLCEALNASTLVVSREGAVFINKDERKLIKASGHNKFGGTLISFRIPFPCKEISTDEFYSIIDGQ